MRIVAATMLAWLVIAAVFLSLSMRQPWLGASFGPTDDGIGIEVLDVIPASPAGARLHPGERLLALRAGGGWLPLQSDDLRPVPTQARDGQVHGYAEQADFYARQQRIFDLLRHPAVDFQRSDGSIATLHPGDSRPWRALPASLILLLTLVHGIVFALAAAVLRRQPDDWAARYYAATAFGVACLLCPVAVLSGRELAVSEFLFRALILIDTGGGTVFILGSSTAMLWHYPQSLSRRAAAPWIFAIALLLALLDASEVMGSIELGFRLPVLAALAAQIAIATAQWRRSRLRPAHRAVLKWLFIPWFGATGLYTLLYLLPPVTGVAHAASPLFAFGFILSMFIGIAFGLTRFRLYYLNPANILVWAVDGLLVINLAWAGFHGLELSPLLASCLALSAAGMLHGTVRDRIWAAQGIRFAHFEKVFGIVLDELAPCRSMADVSQAWRQTLRTLFEPQAMCAGAAPLTRIEYDGERLSIRASVFSEGMVLELPFRGRALFLPEDVRLVENLGRMFDAVARYWEEKADGRRQQRVALAQRLHGLAEGRFVDLERNADQDEPRALAREARGELHRVTEALMQGSGSWGEAQSEWRLETLRRCEEAGLRCEWSGPAGQVPGVPDAITLHHVYGVLREATTNAIRHSRGSRITVRLHADARHLKLVVEDDGRCRPEGLARGNGLINMERRAAALGGNLGLEEGTLGGLRVALSIPITHMGDAPATRPA